MRVFDVTEPATRTVRHVLETQAAENGDTVWLRTDDGTATFDEAHDVVTRYRAGLRALGVGPGDMVAFYTKASIDSILLVQAVAHLGAVVTALNTEYSGAFLEHALHETATRTVIVDADLLHRFEDVHRQLLDHIVVLGGSGDGMAIAGGELLTYGFGAPADDIGWLDPLQVFWSSGTTGRSKGIIHSHSGVLTQADMWLSYRVQPGDVSYVCTPYYLSGAWNCGIWSGLVTGTSVAIDTEFSVSRFWDRVRHFGATHIFTLGAMHMYLWNQPPRADDAASGVRHAMCIPMSWSLIPQFKKRFGIQRMDQTYGATETLTLLRADDDWTRWPDAAMGVAHPDYDVRLLDADDLEVPVGEVGEICVRPNVPGRLFLGYLNAADQTVAGWRNLWHHQGDMAWRDEDGVYYFADRKKDYVRYGGRNISLTEVEAVVALHPDVADLAAFGVESAELESESELALAVVVKEGRSTSADQLARFINDNAPYYFVPRFIDFVDEIPRNAHLKVLRDELRGRGVSPDAWDRRAAGFQLTR